LMAFQTINNVIGIIYYLKIFDNNLIKNVI
jgi:hypothetical protein